MLMNRVRHLLLVLIASASIAAATWSVLRVRALRNQLPPQSNYLSNLASARAATDMWARGIERVKEDRGVEFGGGGAIEIPPELRHYTDRHWFLATQVAEVRKFNVQSCRDFVDLAAMVQRGELVSLPAVTDSYILFGVGAKADDGLFTRYEDEHNVELYDQVELRDAYDRLESARSRLQTEIAGLQTRLAAHQKTDRAKRVELRTEITARQGAVKSERRKQSPARSVLWATGSKAKTVTRVRISASARKELRRTLL